MRRALGAVCIFIVGLQVLVGVPLSVCLVFFVLVQGGPLGPMAIEMHSAGPSAVHAGTVAPSLAAPLAIAPGIAPPPNLIPTALAAPADNPILQSRAEHGSPLAGTVLSQSLCPETEQQLFVAAFEKVAAESEDPISPALVAAASELMRPSVPALACAADEPLAANQRLTAEQYSPTDPTSFAIRCLYAMADTDERAGRFDRADQWRSLARELRAPAAD